MEYQSNIYRIFCCFDEGRLVILFNGFQKKIQKTPKNEIKKTERLMKEYFQSKK
ncbi:type II toxin-antitoxin system RelE/ParE family toxin [Pararhodonellum marinum]|uniref:type II toxin-antitoxin system RelE/ParE family toxin n=1 Tax=Pararhodonellum marinum TaxID=2755358 RepID=UPI00293C0D45|nr:type II toxin-antitoxin system RelE/ParE family toxin [Pararhodonellum marinum]